MQAPSSVAAGDPMADDKVTVGNNASALPNCSRGRRQWSSRWQKFGVSMVRAPSRQARLLAGFETRGRLQEYSRSTLAATVKASVVHLLVL